MSKRYHNLDQHFQDIVYQFPDKHALCFESQSFTYSDLHSSALIYYNGLMLSGVTFGSVVALPAKKIFEVYALVIACLKIGAPYSFYDLKAPNERILSQMKVLGDPVIVIDPDSEKQFDYNIFHDYCNVSIGDLFDSGKNSFSRYKKNLARVEDTSIAYIMFTSGSAGSPKGVAISHGNLLYFCSWIVDIVGVSSGDRISGLNKLYFDNSVFDLYSSFFSGATLYPISDDMLVDSSSLFNYLRDKKISVWFSVPSLLVYHLSISRDSVKLIQSVGKIIFGGEPFPKSSLKQLWDICANKVELINVYGPTECTCICSLYKITKNDFSDQNINKIAPIGIISDYFDYQILNENSEPILDGGVGELVLGGGAVGKGYWEREDLTSKAFISNPVSTFLHDIYYKTGDLVKQTSTGNLEFISRIDHQIKHMGHRIELPEIEFAVLSSNQIFEACAIYKNSNTHGYIKLFYNGLVEEGFVLNLIMSKLPSYMRPRLIVKLAKLPKNRNGKIDRRELEAL
jgi:D-alanine--poly(phosphoribitol) ligase subunit 1